MARRGYAATTVDEIASEPGVSRKALYTHFSGKEDVLPYVVAKAAEEGEPIDLPRLRPRLMAWLMLVFDGPAAAERELCGDI